MEETDIKIDETILTQFLRNNQVSTEISEALIGWHASLRGKAPELVRKKAKEFLNLVAEESLGELHLPQDKQKKLVEVFEPLEKIFRLAVSLRKNENVRDHLNHTIRNYLLSNYILLKYGSEESKLSKNLAVASIFHDIAYPIEKFKMGTRNLAEEVFQEFFSSKGRMNFELGEASNLLEVLDIIGSFDNEDMSFIYTEIVAPAIAGKGLFDAPHCLCSVILFLRPIILDWKNSETYWKTKTNEIADICKAMAFHDRKMYPKSLNNTQLSFTVKSLRMADEFQEWGRDEDPSHSFVKSVKLNKTNPNEFIKLIFYLQDSSTMECRPEVAISDKLIGLIPIVESERIILSFYLPRKTNLDFRTSLKARMQSCRFINKPHIQIDLSKFVSFSNQKRRGDLVDISIHEGKAEVDIHDRIQ